MCVPTCDYFTPVIFSMSEVKKLNRVTPAQQATLCDFFEENPEVIRGYKKKPDCVEAVQLKWKNITPTLNSLGPPRNQRAWAKYLSDIKAKLKRKRITWKQRGDGSGLLMCNAEEFSEISLRMLQVLRQEADEPEPALGENQGFEAETEDTTTNDNQTDGSDESYEEPLSNKRRDNNSTSAHTNLTNELISDRSEPQPVFVNQHEVNDEFDSFGRNIAQQLRSLPLTIALETQETLLSILRKRRLKFLKKTSSDPLTKKTKLN